MLKKHGKVLGTSFLALFLIIIVSFLLTATTQAIPLPSVTKNAQRYKLPNGLTVILKENHASRVCAIQVWVKTGSANETEKEAGVTHLIEHMIFKGTQKRKTGQIAREIEAAGGEINAYTNYDRTVYHVEIDSAHLDTGLDVLLDAVQHSTFDPVELAREKEVVLEEYRRGLDSPARQLAKAVMKLCYKKHPYGRPIIGYENTIRSIKRSDILSYIDRWYTPKNMFIIVVGDFQTAEALERIKALTRNFPHRRGATANRPVEPPQRHYRQRILKENVRQLYLDMSWHIPSLSHPDTPALDVLEVILGQGKSSRLYRRLKARQNLVHDIDASAWEMLDSGLFSIEATLRPDKLHRTIAEIAAVIKHLQSTPIPAAELRKAKRIVEADFLFGMETAAGQASTLGFFEVMTGNIKNCDLYLNQLRSVTAQDLLRVARTYFRPSNMSLVAMAPQDSSVTLKAKEVERLFAVRGLTSQPKAARVFTTSRAKKIVLSNGLRVIIKENHNLPVVSIAAAFLGGSRLEPEGKWGLSQFVAKMLPRGTTRMTASEIALDIESMGGKLEPFSGRNSFGVTAKFISRDLARGIGILANILCDPTFPEDEIEKVRADILQTIRTKQDRPMAQLFDLFYATIYKKHPYGHPTTGTVQTVQGITRNDLIHWYRQMSDPSRLVISVVGDVQAPRVARLLKARFGDLPRRSIKPLTILPEPALISKRLAHIEKKSAQVNFVIGFLGVPLSSPLNAPMELIDTALSGQGGRLFYRLRDKQSLAYAVTSFRRPGLETGAFGVYMGCALEKFAVAKEAVLKQIQLVRDEGLSAAELKRAKEHLLGILAIERQTNSAQAFTMALNELYGLGYDYEGKFIKKIKDVSLEEIRQAAKKVFTLDQYVLVSVGPQSTQAGPCDNRDSDRSSDEDE